MICRHHPDDAAAVSDLRGKPPGQENYNPQSRFIREIPAELVQAVRIQGQSSHSSHGSGSSVPDAPFTLGQAVRHPVFGEGVVLNFEGAGAQARVQVHFANEGNKWLMLSFAKLEAV